jgi:hypothetical protein
MDTALKNMPTQTIEESAVAKAHAKPWFYAPKPTRWTLFLRTFLPWQMWRFVLINVKMIGIIRRSHQGQP